MAGQGKGMWAIKEMTRGQARKGHVDKQGAHGKDMWQNLESTFGRTRQALVDKLATDTWHNRERTYG